MRRLCLYLIVAFLLLAAGITIGARLAPAAAPLVGPAPLATQAATGVCPDGSPKNGRTRPPFLPGCAPVGVGPPRP